MRFKAYVVLVLWFLHALPAPAKAQILGYHQPLRLWPQATIPYSLPPQFEPARRAWFAACLKPWTKAGLTFKDVSGSSQSTGVVKVSKLEDTGLAITGLGTIGFNAQGENFIKLAPHFFTNPVAVMNCHTVQHEMGHVIGLGHEQKHPNRDKFIEIHWDHVPAGLKPQYECALKDQILSPYDRESIMHYGGNTGNGIAISPRGEPLVPFSNKGLISQGDIRAVQDLYHGLNFKGGLH